MSDGMRRELVYLSSYATNRYFIPNWGKYIRLLKYENNFRKGKIYSNMFTKHTNN